MAVAAVPPPSTGASASRPIGLRMRADLRIERQVFDGLECWVVKDPVRLRYFKFDAEEYAVLSMLDGTVSLEQIKRRFEAKFAPQRVTYGELHRLLGMLHRAALTTSDATGQGERLLARRDEDELRRHEAALSNPLAIRFRGVDPQRFLTAIDPWLGWLFSLPGAVLVGILALAAGALLAAEFDVFWRRLPEFQEFFAARNWLLLAVALSVVKALHEVGHGLACRRFGGECHEMGVMLLCFAPCLYCNVTDTWMTRDRWRRAAVGAAGMYVEMLLASLATFVWWNTHLGVVNSLALNVMFTCSVSTLAFNANPLMRYDGYYILSDLIGIPNLRQRAQGFLSRWLAATCLGLTDELREAPVERRPLAMASYAVASTLYGWFVSVSILWFVYKATEPWGLKPIGQGIALLSLWQLVVQPVRRLVQFFGSHRRWRRMNPFRATIAAIVAALLLAALILAPIPRQVACECQTQPLEGASVYVDLAGRLDAILVRPGERVQKGQPLARLSNPEVAQRFTELESQVARLSARRDHLERAAVDDESSGSELVGVRKTLASAEEQLERRRQEAERLTILAPRDGQVFARPSLPSVPDDTDELPEWSGHPLESHNLGAWLRESDLVCVIGDPTRIEATLAVDQRELDSVAVGQTVDVYLDQLPGRRFRGRLVGLAAGQMRRAAAGLSHKSGGGLVTETGADGVERPVEVVYEGSVPLDDPAGRIVAGGHGTARIRVGSSTALERIWRAAAHTFHFDL